MTRLHMRIHHVSALACMLICSSSAMAGTFHWGDLSDPGGDVMYLAVTENNGEATPLYDEDPNVGSPDVIGNSILFNPQGFQSSSSGNAADSIDSTLTTTVMAKPGQAVESISISELGDYTLSGLPGGNAQATVGAAFFWTILEINGVPNPQPTQMDNMMFASGAGTYGGEYNRPGDDGTTTVWSGSVFLDVREWLDNNGHADDFATKVGLRFDNTLTTAADAVSSAFIKKKQIGGSVIVTVDTSSMVPEPTTCVLAGLAALGLVAVRRMA